MGERYQALEMMEWGRQNKGRRHNIEGDGRGQKPASLLSPFSRGYLHMPLWDVATAHRP